MSEPEQQVNQRAPDEAVVQKKTILNRKGLHARASAKFVKLAECFDAEMSVTKDGVSVGATSILGLMMLSACLGSSVTLSATGPEAGAALEALGALIDSGFEEDTDGLSSSAN